MADNEINVLPEVPAAETIALSESELYGPAEDLNAIAISRSVLEKITTVASHADGVAYTLKSFRETNQPLVLSFVNAHALNLCHADARFRKAILASGVVFRDGIGMEIFFRSAEQEAGHNMCGTDVIPLLLQQMVGQPLAVFGTAEPYLSKAVTRLSELGHNVVSVMNGFESIDAYINAAIEQQPAVIVLAMGMPKQEMLSMALQNFLEHRCLIINGGAIIDHYGGKVDRAPQWMRNNGLEWLYRLIHEPVRLFNRYVVGNISFLYRVYRATGRIRLR